MKENETQLTKVVITEKKRVKVKNSFALIDEPKVTIYVARGDLSLFMEEMYLLRIKPDMGVKPIL